MDIYTLFDLSKRWGFLPNECKQHLPSSFQRYNRLCELLPGDPLAFRREVDRLQASHPIAEPTEFYDHTGLNECGVEDLRCIYSIFSLFVHKFVMKGDKTHHKTVIPPVIGLPFCRAANLLGIKPVLTHAALDLFNWHVVRPSVEAKQRAPEAESKQFLSPLSPASAIHHADITMPPSFIAKSPSSPPSSSFDFKEIMQLDDMRSNHLMTGNKSESWFSLVMVAIEAHGGRLIELAMRLTDHRSMVDPDGKKIAAMQADLQEFSEHLRRMSAIVRRTYEHCDADFFFHQLRHLLQGSYDDVWTVEVTPERHLHLKWKGGSAAQSSLIQLIDIVFHDKADAYPAHARRFLDEMRSYMPHKHREFLEFMEHRAVQSGSLREFVAKHRHDRPELVAVFNKCVKGLAQFRQSHFRLVDHYILQFVHGPKRPSSSSSSSLPAWLAVCCDKVCPKLRAAADRLYVKVFPRPKAIGTGKTDLEAFLKPLIDATLALALVEDHDAEDDDVHVAGENTESAPA